MTEVRFNPDFEAKKTGSDLRAGGR